MSVEVIILVDNTPGVEGLRAEHGLAVLVSGPGRKVLFDTAATAETLLANAQALGVDLGALDAAIVSHGHHDHTGGLAEVLRKRPGLTVYMHEGAFSRRWSEQPGQPLRDISCPHTPERLSQAGGVVRSIAGPEQLESWLLVSGPIGGPKHGRDVFVVRKAGEIVVDGFEDEMCLLVRGERGWVTVTGCCHRGLKNTLRTAQFLARGEPVVALLGGLHLHRAGEEELRGNVELLREYGIRDVYPCHCTGERSMRYLRGNMPGQVHPLTVGSRVVF